MEEEADVEEVAMVTTAEGRGFPEDVRDLRPPLGPTPWPLLFFLPFASDAAATVTFPGSAARPSLEALPPGCVDDTSWKLALVKRAAALSSSRFCDEVGRGALEPPLL